MLPARLLLDVVRSLPSPSVSLELRPAEQDVEVLSGNATFHIRTLHAEDFPPFPEPDPGIGDLDAGSRRSSRPHSRSPAPPHATRRVRS